MRSLVVAVVAGVVVGMLERVVFYNWANQSGLIEFVLFGIVLGAVLFAHRGASGGDGGAWALSSRVAPLPDRLRSHLLVRRMPWVPALLALVVAVVIPLMIDTNARYFLYSRMALIAIVVVSVTILTGWAGQLSLAQFALAGLGAMTMAGADLHLNLQFLPAVLFAVAVCVGGRRGDGHPVVPGAGDVPGDRHPGVRQRRLRVAVPPADLQRRSRRVPLRARPPAHRLARSQRPPHLLPRLPRRAGDDRAHGQPAAPLGCGSGPRGRARQRAVGGGVHHRPPGDEAVGLRPRRRAGAGSPARC